MWVRRLRHLFRSPSAAASCSSLSYRHRVASMESRRCRFVSLPPSPPSPSIRCLSLCHRAVRPS
ncbi:hypothetical protein LINPERHAP2_LOCUS16255 [Linum perenne]